MTTIKSKKKVSESLIENFQIQLFTGLAIDEIICGSKLLQIVEKVAMEVAKKHSDHNCIPKGIDFVRFFNTAKKGDLLYCYASINRVWDSFMEVGIKVIADDFRMLDRKKIMSAYFTFLATNLDNQKIIVPEIIAETSFQKKRFLKAEIRRRSKNRVLC